MVSSDDLSWAQKMTSDANLGDVRRNARASRVLLAMVDSPGVSLSKAAGGSSAAVEQYYRHVRASNVCPDELLKAGCSAVGAEIEGVCGDKGDVALIGDTTTLSYRHAAAADLGPMSCVRNAVNRGWLVHTVLAVQAETGATMGPVEQLWWSRDEKTHGKAKSRNQRAYETRESYKWECSANVALERLGEAASRAIFVTDRESDVFEYLSDSVGWGRRFVVRCGRNRCIEEENSYVTEQCTKQPLLATVQLQVAQKGNRKSRQAILEIRAAAVTVLPPKDLNGHPPPVAVNAICVSEINAPPNNAAIRWLLLTTEPTVTADECMRVIKLYALRWRVEEFHKFWKSEGMRVESLRMATPANLRRVAVLMAFAACRLMRLRDAVVPPTCHLLTREGEEKKDNLPTEPDAPCNDLLSELQWKMLWVLTNNSAPPNVPPSRRWASFTIAKMGGWTDTKHTGRPGYKAYIAGWQCLMQACQSVEIAARLSGILPQADSP